MSSNIILVTGGSRSGKSTFAENLYDGNDYVAYIATALITDEEMQERILMHQKSRNQKWTTIEAYKDLKKVIPYLKEESLLLDCATVMITNLMFHEERDFEKITKEDLSELEKEIIWQFKSLIEEVRVQNKKLVIVTNEVGYGLVPEYKLGRIFRDIAGRVNQHLACWSDEVYLVACGLPIKLK